MISRRRHALVAGFALALTCIPALTGAANARSIYDGAWSVLIVTNQGPCDRTYRYGVLIADGMVSYDGANAGLIAIKMQGRVTPKGAVRVILQAGSQWADGSGRLTKNRGTGVWRGQGMGGTCAGVWEAERRPPGLR